MQPELGPPGIGIAESAAQESVSGVEKEDAAVGGGRRGREGGVVGGIAVGGESWGMDLGAGEDVGEQGLAAAEEEEVAVRVAEPRGGEGFIGEKGFEGGARVVEGVEAEVGGGGLRGDLEKAAAAATWGMWREKEERGAAREVDFGARGTEERAPGTADAGEREQVGEGGEVEEDGEEGEVGEVRPVSAIHHHHFWLRLQDERNHGYLQPELGRRKSGKTGFCR